MISPSTPAAFTPVEPPYPYHRMLRAVPEYRWWRPLLAILLAGVFLVIASLLVVILGVVLATVFHQIDWTSVEGFTSGIQAIAVLDAANPVRLFAGIGSVAVWVPAILLGVRAAGIRPSGVLHSVQLRLRFRWLASCLIPAAIVMAVNLALTLWAEPLITRVGPQAPTTALPLYLGCALLILVLVPFQAAAEEYFFRGLLAQAIGSWVRFAPLAIVVPTLLFVSGHFYDIWGLLDVAIFGVAAGWLAWRTGGLESGIALHAMPNVSLFLLLASGALGSTVNGDAAGSPLDAAVTLVLTAGYALWVDRQARRRGIARLGTGIAVPATELHSS